MAIQLPVEPSSFLLLGACMFVAGFTSGSITFGVCKSTSMQALWSTALTIKQMQTLSHPLYPPCFCRLYCSITAIMFHLLWTISTIVFGLEGAAFKDTVGLLSFQVCGGTRPPAVTSFWLLAVWQQPHSPALYMLPAHFVSSTCLCLCHWPSFHGARAAWSSSSACSLPTRVACSLESPCCLCCHRSLSSWCWPSPS